MNFENRALDTEFFASDDGRSWMRIVPGISTLPAGMVRVEVDPAVRDRRFRFLKVAKTRGKSSPLFEPSELRIFGRRHEVPR